MDMIWLLIIAGLGLATWALIRGIGSLVEDGK